MVAVGSAREAYSLTDFTPPYSPFDSGIPYTNTQEAFIPGFTVAIQRISALPY